MMCRVLTIAFVVSCIHETARAHGHHNDEAISDENFAKPIDAMLWLHILVQVLTWGFMFPIGMVLGLARWALRLLDTALVS